MIVSLYSDIDRKYYYTIVNILTVWCIFMSTQYNLVPQYDTMEGYSQDGIKVVNMFRTYEEEDLR